MYSASEAINRFERDAPRPWELNGGIGLGYSQSFSIARRTFLASIGGHQHWTVDAVLSNARAVEHLIDLPAVAKSRLNGGFAREGAPENFCQRPSGQGRYFQFAGRRSRRSPSPDARTAGDQPIAA